MTECPSGRFGGGKVAHMAQFYAACGGNKGLVRVPRLRFFPASAVLRLRMTFAGLRLVGLGWRSRSTAFPLSRISNRR